MGKKVGDYTIEKKIGEGHYGTVYTAVQISTGRIVAAKVISLRQLSTKLLSQTEAEIRSLRQLRSHYIIQLFDVLKTINNVYLFMEYCPGGDLQSYLREHGKIYESLGKKWLSQLVEAFIVLQSNKILHRDLKLANILLTENSQNGDVKIGDFGFAKILNENSLAITQLGTPMYMAPELFQHEYYSHKADVWSLGVLSYEILFGQAVFSCRSIKELRLKQRERIKFPRNAHVSREAKDFIRRALVYNSEERPSFEELRSHPFLVDVQDLPEPSHMQITDPDVPYKIKTRLSEIDIPQKSIELDFQVTQVESIFSYHEDFLYLHNRHAALSLAHYSKTMFSQFLQVTQGFNDMELYERIEFLSLRATAAYEEIAGSLQINTGQEPSQEELSLLVSELISEMRTLMPSSQDKKKNLLILIAANDLVPGHAEGATLLEQAQYEFKQAYCL